MSTACSHGGRTATQLCVRCGDFVCDACRVWRRGVPWCGACVQRLGRKPSGRAQLALLMSCLGMCTGVTGLVGIVLASRELRAIERGESPEEGEVFARTARALGWVDLAVVLLVVVLKLVQASK